MSRGGHQHGTTSHCLTERAIEGGCRGGHSSVYRQVERGLQARQLADQAAALQRRLELLEAGHVAQRHQRLALPAQQLLLGAVTLHQS